MKYRKNIMLIATLVSFYSPVLGQTEKDSIAQASDTITWNKTLDEVTVVAKRIKDTPSGYTINLRGDRIVEGKRAGEVLQFLPGITKDGNSLKVYNIPVGSIYINGMKISNPKELEDIPADKLQEVEVEYMSSIEDPLSANNGVIRLTIERPKDGGYYGNVSGDYDATFKYGENTLGLGNVFYYGNKKVGLYNYASLSKKRFQDDVYHEYHYQDAEQPVLMKNYEIIKGLPIFDRFSLTYDFTPHHILGMGLHIGYNHNRNRMFSHRYENTQWDDLGWMNNERNRLRAQVTLKYTAKLDDNGSKFSVAGDYLHMAYKTDYTATSDYSHYDKSYNLWKFRSDLIRHIGKSFLSVGIIATIIRLNYTQGDISDGWISRRQGNAVGDGFRPVLYTGLQGSIGKLRYNAVLGYRYNHVKYTDKDYAIVSKNHQQAFTPSLKITYPIDRARRHQLVVNIWHELKNIPYDAINSSVVWKGGNIYQTGNPNLKAPSMSSMMTVLSLFNNKLTFTGVANHRKNEIHYIEATDPDNKDMIISKPVNYEGETLDFGFGTEINLRLFKIWATKIRAWLSVEKENAKISGIQYDGWNSRTSFLFNNSVNITKSFGFTLKAFFEPTFTTYDRKYHSVYTIDGKLYKTFGKNFEMALNFIAYQKMRQLSICSNNLYHFSKNNTREESVGLTLTWRFNKGKKVQMKRTESLQDFEEITDSK
ncbi:MAG: outer membrane beta-barrel protein [Prevotella sp.]|nr:outer membrane beta-barrel protein [Prevotella sp.]